MPNENLQPKQNGPLPTLGASTKLNECSEVIEVN